MSRFKPNRELLNVNFQGYKLSDEHLDEVSRIELPSPVAVAAVREGEYSYQLVKAHAFHNHLHFDPQDPLSVYWCAKDGSIKKANLKDDTVSFQTVLHLARNRMEHLTNPTIEFLGMTMGVVCAGDNKVTLFHRDRETKNEKWIVLKSLDVSENKPVKLMTSSLGERADILCAELNFPSLDKEGVSAAQTAQDPDKYVATYKWVRVEFKVNPMLAQTGPNDVESWKVLGTFQSKSLALYSTFQYHPPSREKQLLLISETVPLMDPGESDQRNESVLVSGNTAQDSTLFSESEQHCGLGFKRDNYKWTQSDTDITISFQLAEDVKKGDISCVLEANEVVVGLSDGTTFLQGEPTHSIDPQASTWTIENHK